MFINLPIELLSMILSNLEFSKSDMYINIFSDMYPYMNEDDKKYILTEWKNKYQKNTIMVNGKYNGIKDHLNHSITFLKRPETDICPSMFSIKYNYIYGVSEHNIHWISTSNDIIIQSAITELIGGIFIYNWYNEQGYISKTCLMYNYKIYCVVDYDNCDRNISIITVPKQFLGNDDRKYEYLFNYKKSGTLEIVEPDTGYNYLSIDDFGNIFETV